MKAYLDDYIKITEKLAPELRVAIVVSILNETKNFTDFAENSVTTSYLTREEVDRLIGLFRENNIYVELFNDVESFFKNYYSSNWKCNAIFESSPKGIAKGKDALLPSFCDTVGLLHFGPNAAANLRTCNKYFWYCTLAKNNIPVPNTFLYNNGWVNYPTCENLLLKLNEECASIGLSPKSLMKNCDIPLLTQHAQKLQLTYNEPVIAQQFINGYEVEVPILSNIRAVNVLPAVGLSLAEKQKLDDFFFNYESIFNNEYGVYLYENVNEQIANQLYEICEKVIKILDLQGHFRIDFRISPDGKPFITDINIDPTMGLESSFLYSVKSLGYSDKDLIAIVLGNYLINQTNIEYR